MVFCSSFFFQMVPAQAVKHFPAIPSDDEKHEVSQLGRLSIDERYATLRRLSPEKKKRYVELFRQFDSDLEWRQGRTSEITWKSLLSLGDPITAQYLVSEFQKAGEGEYKDEELLHMLGLWCAPEAVPFLAGLADSDAPPPEFAMPSHRGCTFVAAETLFRNLGYAYYLPKEVQAWGRNKYKDYVDALGMQGDIIEQQLRNATISYDEYMSRRKQDGREKLLQNREIAKQWWRDNRETFFAGRFHEVKPGGIMATPELKREHQALGTASGPQHGELPDVPLPSATSTLGGTENPLAPLAGEKHAHSRTTWPWLVAGIAALLGVLAMFFKRRNPGRKSDSQK